MKAKVLVDDPLCTSGDVDVACRYVKGEVGELLDHDSTKYDYLIDFGWQQFKKPVEVFGDYIYGIQRTYFFYKTEVEVINDKD